MKKVYSIKVVGDAKFMEDLIERLEAREKIKLVDKKERITKDDKKLTEFVISGEYLRDYLESKIHKEGLA